MTDNILGVDSGYIPPPRTKYTNNSLYGSEKAENCSYIWENGDYQKYVGEFLQGNLHGYGQYVRLDGSESCMYEGSFYANNFEGYSNVVYMNGDYFEGLFKCNRRFGPGVYTYADGSQSVGLWYGTQLIRLSSVVMSEWVPKLARSSSAKLKLLKYRKLVSIKREYEDVAKNALIKLNAPPELIAMSDKLYNRFIRNPNSLFFNKTVYDIKFFGELDCTIDVAESDTDLVTLSSARSSITPTAKLNFSAKEIVQEILDYLMENVSIVEEFPEAERKNFLYESILTARKFFQLEQDTAIINSILDDFMDDLDNILSKPNDERTLILNKRIVQKLLPQDQKSRMDLNIKKIVVTDLLAWNNEEMYMDMLKHVFLHRNKENVLSFSIAKLLSGDREKFNPTGELEKNCVLFLCCCSVGNENEAMKIFNENMLNPDVCDARGNAGIIFAASRDMWKVIKLLCDLGANLDIVNDEGLTALSICLLRYVALQNDILDWERAFIPDATVTYEEELQIKQWHPHVSLTNLNVLSNVTPLERYTSTDAANMKDGKAHFKIGEALDTMTDGNTDICNSDVYEEFRKIEIDMVFKHFQEPYLENVDVKQNYVFSAKTLPPLKAAVLKFNRGQKKQSRSKSNDKSVKKSEVTTKKPRKKDDDKISFAKQNKLNVVLTTIRVLLNCGADPNLSIVPLPVLLLTLFCNDLELFDLILKSGADPDVATQDEGLSALHMLCSLPFTTTNLERFNILLNTGANPNIRTNTYHWMQEKEKIMGKRDLLEEDPGKTPLHILSMRYDYTNNEDIQKAMAESLINKGGNVHDRYLGHEPFTLAILRGNLELIKYYLDSGLIDPYRKLGEDMGVATTILILKRYSNILPLENCKAVYELFMEKNVNPLVMIEGNGNAIEFMEAEYTIEKSQRGSAIIKKQKSAKSTSRGRSKSPKSNRSSRTSKSSGEGVKRCLIECTKKMLQRYIQHQAYKYIKRFIMQSMDPENEIITTLIRFLPIKDLVHQIQLLIYNGLIEPKPSHFYVILSILELSKKYNKINEKKLKSNDIVNLPSEAIIKKFDWIQRESMIYFNMVAPELDTETEKYKVCFYCLKQIEKELIVCPNCGLVYFCCQECNRLSNKESTIHKCNTLFFDKQKTLCEQAKENNVDFEISALDREIEILNDIFKEKFGSRLDEMGISTDFDYSKLNSTIFESMYENDTNLLKSINAAMEEHNISSLDEDIKLQQQRLLEAKLRRDKGVSSTNVSLQGDQRKAGRDGRGRSHVSRGSLPSDDDIKGTKRKKGKAGSRRDLFGKDAKDNRGDRLTGETYSQATKGGTKTKRGAKSSEKSFDRGKSGKNAKDLKVGKGSKKSFATDKSAGRGKGKGGKGSEKSFASDKFTRKGKGTKGGKGSEKSFASDKFTRKGKGTKGGKGSEKSFASGKSARNAKGAKGAEDGKNTKGRSKSKDSHGTTKIETLYRRDKKYPKADKSSKYAVYKHDISKSDYTRSMRGKYEQEQGRMREKYPGKSGLQDWLSDGRFGYSVGFGKLTKGISRIANEFNRLPHKCQFFIENLSALFPGIDFSLLFWPYVCYVDGQLYYRFLEERPVFLETYSNV